MANFSVDESHAELGYEELLIDQDVSASDVPPSTVLSVLHVIRPYIKPNIFGISVHNLLNCGSQKTLVSVKVASLWTGPKTKIIPSNIILISASGDALNVVGCIYLPFDFRDQIIILETTIIGDLPIAIPIDYITGMDFFFAFNLHISQGTDVLFLVDYEENSDSNPHDLVEFSSEQEAALEIVEHNSSQLYQTRSRLNTRFVLERAKA